MTVAELRRLDVNELTGAEAIALTYVLDGLKTGKLSSGDKSRRDVTRRLDGPDDDSRGAPDVTLLRSANTLQAGP